MTKGFYDFIFQLPASDRSTYSRLTDLNSCCRIHLFIGMYRERRRGYWFLIGSDRSSSAIVVYIWPTFLFSSSSSWCAAGSINSEWIDHMYTQHTKGFLSTHMWGVCCCCYRGYSYTIGRQPSSQGTRLPAVSLTGFAFDPLLFGGRLCCVCVVRWSTSLYNNLVLPVLLSPCIYGCISLYK